MSVVIKLIDSFLQRLEMIGVIYPYPQEYLSIR